MRVALAVDALSPELTGIGRYCWELATRLPSVEGCDAVSYYRDTQPVADPTELLRPAPPPAPRKTGLGPAIARTRRKLGRAFARKPRPSLVGIDVFHAPNFFLPAWVEAGIATVHDLSVLRYPETHPIERVRMFERRFARSLARSTHIITDTQTVRDEVIAHFGLAPERVTAVPLGIAEHFRPMPKGNRDPVLAALGLPTTGYGLSISTLEPRKRIAELLAAWERLPVVLRQTTPLVIAGAAGWRNAALHETIARGAAEGWVIPLGFVAEEHLPALYSGASLFVYPSRYEGFGLPPLEAMACGVPVIVANASCLPEVTRGAAMLVEPDDLVAFGESIAMGLEDHAWRNAAKVRGVEVSSGYGWDVCAQATFSVYGANRASG